MNTPAMHGFCRYSIGALTIPLAVVLALAGCGGGGGSSGTTPSQEPVMVVTPPSNRAPEVASEVGFGDKDLTVGDGPEGFDLEASPRNFTDPDDDELTYTVSSSDTSVVRAEISGTDLIWEALAAGMATITVVASDPDGLTARLSFAATVTGASPDLTVGVSDRVLLGDGSLVSTVEAGSSFEVGTTARNLGTAAADSSTIRFYFSSNATISSNDTQVGTERTSAGTGIVFNRNKLLTAPTSPGTYYYGACVDPVPGESNTNNNCSDGVRLTVDEGASPPDLTVGVSDRVLLGDGSLVNTVDTGASIEVGTTARNLGTTAADSSTIRFYFSSNATISSNDTQVGTERTSAGTGIVFNRNKLLTAPSSPGTYYYGACVDPVPGESNTNNNCSDGVRLTVEEGASPPDLTVEVSDRVVLDNGSLVNTVDTGASIEVGTTARNLGTTAADSSTIRFYFSSNATISSNDTQVGTERTSAGTGIVFNRNKLLTAPSSPGTYYYGACVDPVPGESNTNNNCSDGVRLTVEQDNPTITFRFTDGCNDGFGIVWRAFEQRNDDLTGLEWPGQNRNYVIPPGDTHVRVLACTTGTDACYGASTDETNPRVHWGVGVNGDRGCDNCCIACPVSGNRTHGLNLVCR